MEASQRSWRHLSADLQQVDSLLAAEGRALQRAQQTLATTFTKLQDMRRRSDAARGLVGRTLAGALDNYGAITPAALPNSLPPSLRPHFGWLVALLRSLRQPRCLADVLSTQMGEPAGGLVDA
eukprot:5597371-Prymnesium_polylepis.1